MLLCHEISFYPCQCKDMLDIDLVFKTIILSTQNNFWIKVCLIGFQAGDVLDLLKSNSLIIV